MLDTTTPAANPAPTRPGSALSTQHSALSTRYSLLVPLLFLLLSAAFLWQPILTGGVLLPTDLSFEYDFMWNRLPRVEGQAVAQNPLLSDVALYYYPYAGYAMERLAAGHFPLWNPYILGGTPFFASAQAAVLDPVNLLSYQAGPYAYWTLGAWLRLALLGLGTYGFLRALGRSRAAGTASGVIFMVSGFAAVWLNYNVVTTLAWLPALFWATTHMLRGRRRVWVAATALLLGALLLGGHPETQFLAGLVWGAYGLYTLGALRARLAPGAFLRFAGAAALGLALGAVQWLTFSLFLLQSSALQERAWGIGDPTPGDTLLRLAVVFFPNFAGNPLSKDAWYSAVNFNEQTGYIGLLAVGLAVIGTAQWFRRDRLVPFFALLGLLSLLLAIQTPGLHLVKALPLFNVGHGVRWLLVWSFCGAVLAGYGVDALVSPRTGRVALFRAGAGLSAAAAAAGAGLMLVYLGIRFGEWDRGWQSSIDHAQMARLFHPTNLALYWPVIFLGMGAAVLLAWWRGLLPKHGAAALLVLLLYADLWTFGSRYNPVTPVPAIYPPTGPIAYLREHLGHERFAGVTGLFWPNVPMLFHLRDLRGYEDLVDEQFARLYRPVIGAVTITDGEDVGLSAAEHRLLSLAGVRYILTLRKVRVEGDAAAYRWVAGEGPVAVYENRDALPRAYVVFSSEVYEDAEQAERRLRDSAHDPRRAVVITGGAEEMEGPALDPDAAPVTWRRDDPEEVVLEAELPAPGYLVLSDTDAGGWEALLDGSAVPLLRANAVFRAVRLPAGRHTVTFRYRPPAFYAGAAVSAAALLLIAATAASDLLSIRRKPTATSPGESERNLLWSRNN